MMTSLENKVKGIFEGFQEPYLLLGVSGTIYWANTVFWERIDISQENSDKPKLKLCNELCDEKHINEFLSLLSKGKAFRFSLENYDTRGGKYILDLDAQPFEHEEENSEALFLIAAKEITQIEKDRRRLKLLEAALTVADDVVLISEAEPIDGGGA